MSAPHSIRPTMTRLQVSAVVTLLSDLESITLGIEQMPEEFWHHLNAAASVLSAELLSGPTAQVMQ